MTERDIVRKLLTKLNALPECKAIKIHGSPYQRAGTPDVIGCRKGQMFCIEVKRAGARPTAIQKLEMRQWKAAGAEVCVLTGIEEMQLILGEEKLHNEREVSNDSEKC